MPRYQFSRAINRDLALAEAERLPKAAYDSAERGSMERLLDIFKRPTACFRHVSRKHGDGAQGKAAEEKISGEWGCVQNNRGEDGYEPVGKLYNQLAKTYQAHRRGF
jgi:hypothetical protein